jgi:hypothetical protein
MGYVSIEDVVVFVTVAGAFGTLVGLAGGLAWATYAHETPKLADTAGDLARHGKRNERVAHNAVTVRRKVGGL